MTKDGSLCVIIVIYNENINIVYLKCLKEILFVLLEYIKTYYYFKSSDFTEYIYSTNLLDRIKKTARSTVHRVS